jgi:hypothetical protein
MMCQFGSIAGRLLAAFVGAALLAAVLAVGQPAEVFGVDAALAAEEQRYKAARAKLRNDERDAKTQNKIDRRNCGSDRACQRQAAEALRARMIEIKNARDEEDNRHKKRKEEIRTGAVTAQTGDVFSTTSPGSGQPPGSPTPPPAGESGGAPSPVPPAGTPPGQDRPRTEPPGRTEEYPQYGQLFRRASPSGRITGRLDWDGLLFEKSGTGGVAKVRRKGFCSFDLEFSPTGTATAKKIVTARQTGQKRERDARVERFAVRTDPSVPEPL